MIILKEQLGARNKTVQIKIDDIVYPSMSVAWAKTGFTPPSLKKWATTTGIIPKTGQKISIVGVTDKRAKRVNQL